MIIYRYLIKEILITFLAVLLVLLLIFMGNFFGRYLSWAAEGFIASGIVMDLLLYRTLGALSVLLPFTLFIAVLIAFGRMYKDSEMTALSASGVQTSMILKPVFMMSLVFAVLVGGLSFVASPWTEDQSQRLVGQNATKAEFEGIAAGKFAQLKDNENSVFYTQKLGPDRKQMQNIFVQIREKDDLVVYLANKGYQTTDSKTGERYFILVDGYRYQLRPGDSALQLQQYRKSGFRIEEKSAAIKPRSIYQIPTLALYDMTSKEAIAELQWRIALPVSTFLLPLLAALLSQTSPRKGRFGKLFLAIIVFVLYNNALNISRNWIENQQLPAALGMWWVHCLLVFFIVFLYVRQSGWMWSRRYSS